MSRPLAYRASIVAKAGWLKWISVLRGPLGTARDLEHIPEGHPGWHGQTIANVSWPVSKRGYVGQDDQHRVARCVSPFEDIVSERVVSPGCGTTGTRRVPLSVR